MNAVNPYAAPRAAVADVPESDEAVQPVRIWSGRGRVGRLRYLAHITVAYFLLLPITFVAAFVLGAMRVPGAATIGFIVAFGPYIVFLVQKTMQRSHDMDWSGWTALLALIPFVGLLWIFKAGTPGANRFGGPPPPNGLGVKILGFLFPLIGIIGIIAAIALPAYQDYTKRAKAMQTR